MTNKNYLLLIFFDRINRIFFSVSPVFSVSLWYIFLLLFFILTITCDRPRSEQYEPQLNIFCVLLSHRSQQEAIIDRTYRMDEIAKYDLENVRVILSKTNLSDTFVQISDTLGRFISKNHIPIIPCSTYHILVTAQGFDTLTGTTTIPDDFLIIHPLDEDTITFNDTLVFKKSKGATGYSINFLILEDSTWFSAGGTLLHSIEDSIIRINLFDFHPFSDSSSLKIKIAALDTNYFKYAYYGSEDSLLTAGVYNGLGLFGSAVIESVMVFTRPVRSVRPATGSSDSQKMINKYHLYDRGKK